MATKSKDTGTNIAFATMIGFFLTLLVLGTLAKHFTGNPVNAANL